MNMYSWQLLINTAWERRQEITEEGQTDSWRVFHGYNEGVNGVSIEKFGDVAVVDYKVDIRDSLEDLADALCRHHPFKLIMAKGHQALGLRLNQRVFPIFGELASNDYFGKEFGVKYHIQPGAAHNSGLYLDARPVRAWLRDHCKDRRILNLFSFAGSLGVAAAHASARSVIHLDKSSELVPRIRKSYSANRLRLDNRDFVQGDVYKHLPRAAKAEQRFDGIILDPPPKVFDSPHAKNKPLGQDFHQLVKMCHVLLNSGGWLIAMFHRFDSTWEQEEDSVIKASNGELILETRFTSGIDFPEDNPNNKLRVSIFRKPGA